MSENKKAFDIQGVLDNIKTMINPVGNTPNPNADDEIGIKLASLSVMVQELHESYAEQGKKLSSMNKLFNEVFQTLEQSRQQAAEPKAEPKPEEDKA